MNDSQLVVQYLKHSIPTLTDGTKIIKISNTTYDIFVGEGWANRSRYRKVGGKLQYVTGNRLTNSQVQNVSAY